MDWNTPDYGAWTTKLVLRVSSKLRSRKAYTNEAVARANANEAEKRRRQAIERRKGSSHDATTRQSADVNELGEREYSIFSDASTLVDGAHHQPKDHTDMMHRLAHHDSFDSLVDVDVEKLKDPFFSREMHDEQLRERSERHERMVAMLPAGTWRRIASLLEVQDAASLALSSKVLREKLGDEFFRALNLPENRDGRAMLLRHRDKELPGHLFCFQCMTYHRRLHPGKERLTIDFVASPVFACPMVRASVLPRMRLAHNRELPYAFVQLALREHNFSSHHGIPDASLARVWKCRDSTWSHRSRYMIHDGHLLVRVVSRTFAPANLSPTAERHLLYDREEYTPFFSACAHWRNGELMRVCKCALAHIPKPPDPYIAQLKRAPKISVAAARPNFIVRGCDVCQPARRCPECPTEYLVEVQMAEDKNDAACRFKHAIVVTRWSDLGDGSSPFTSPEWTAIKGEQATAYESFSQVGRRAVSGVFESKISGSIPGQRMISLNPKMEKSGIDANGWY